LRKWYELSARVFVENAPSPLTPAARTNERLVVLIRVNDALAHGVGHHVHVLDARELHAVQYEKKTPGVEGTPGAVERASLP